MSGRKRVIFAGAGHANIAALRHLARNPPDADILLVNHGRKVWYTGALPAFIRGEIPEHRAWLDAASLAASCKARFIDGKITSHDGTQLTLENRPPVGFDILALSTGAAANGGVKPIEAFVNRLKTWDQYAAPAIAIIGAGPAGVELALALRHRLGGKAGITLHAQHNTILPNAPRAARKSARAALAAAGIATTATLPANAANPIHAYTPAPTIPIRRTLQLTTHDHILAAGDCAAFPTKLPRSGAIAVRQGRTLAANIRHLLANTAPQPFHPPNATLAIISLSPTRAIACYGPICWTGRLPMTLKSRLDAAWVEGG